MKQYPCTDPACWSYPHTHTWSYDQTLARLLAKWKAEVAKEDGAASL